MEETNFSILLSRPRLASIILLNHKKVRPASCFEVVLLATTDSSWLHRTISTSCLSEMLRANQFNRTLQEELVAFLVIPHIQREEADSPQVSTLNTAFWLNCPQALLGVSVLCAVTGCDNTRQPIQPSDQFYLA
jgi:hypothetical protein